ncbi:D-alanyl-D-alanine carboxypeptidase, partial [Escherichia coli]|nr:D-alanyl-D-alanine carboxypeptidase [Escherichia coli]
MTEETMEETGEDWPAEPSIVAPSGVLMEASTGTVLYDKNMHEQYYPASITKIMTALLAIENCELDEMVTVPHEAVYMEDKGSHIALDEGEELTVEDCLYAIMLASAN